MAKLENKSKDNPRLEQRLLKDGQISLYLEYYMGRESVPVLDADGNPVLYESGKMAGTPKFKVTHKRRKENLNLYLIEKPKTPLDRTHNKETLKLAKLIRQEREQELLEQGSGYRLRKDRKINFLDYFQTYIDTYTKADIRMIKLAFARFQDFLNDTPEYKKYSKCIRPENIDKDMMAAFTEYLQSRGKGEGPRSVYKRFKKVINHAVEHDVLKKNPCKGVTMTVDEMMLRKEILSPEEIQKLIDTHYSYENSDMRRAFIFCLFAGLRYCDVASLTFANVDYTSRLLRFEQAKTKGHSANSGVVIPLNDGLLHLIDKPSEGQTKDSLIFNLPIHATCLKALKRWMAAAGIDKHITWHCARHSFAVNILNNGANIKVVANLLGHSGLKHTDKYTRAVDKLKEDAINSLGMPDLKF